MKLTRAAEYGIRALMHLAHQPVGKVCLLSDISKAAEVPEKFLAKIMQELSHDGLVKSHRGIKGGFSLALAPGEITLKDVVECLEGPIALNICLTGDSECERTGGCSVHRVWQRAQDELISILAGADLKTLSEAGK